MATRRIVYAPCRDIAFYEMIALEAIHRGISVFWYERENVFYTVPFGGHLEIWNAL